MTCPQADDDGTGVNRHDLPGLENTPQHTDRLLVLGAVKDRKKNDTVGDIEIRITGRQAFVLAIIYRPGHRQLLYIKVRG